MAYKDKCKLALVLVLLLTTLSGCGPEGNRARGAGFGTGADPGNHPPSGEVKPRSKVFPGESRP